MLNKKVPFQLLSRQMQHDFLTDFEVPNKNQCQRANIVQGYGIY